MEHVHHWHNSEKKADKTKSVRQSLPMEIHATQQAILHFTW